jgi:kynureninase
VGDSQLALAGALASHYRRFRVTERILLTGHSHQAWPDVAFEGQQQAWLDAAEFVDGKWGRAAEKAAAVKAGYARLLGDKPEHIALGANTHELVIRWLSALDLRARRQLVTTDGEFHAVRRQLARLAEAGVDVVRVAARPVDTLAERLAAAVSDRTAAAIVSSVLFETAEIVPGLDQIAAACRHHGAALLVDAYHHLNVVPFDVTGLGLDDAFVTGGGYKYCQLGEGNAFLRLPPDSHLRPVITGWFAEFETVVERKAPRHGIPESVPYGPGPAAFAGATYDPTSHYRAAAVFDFFAQQELTPARLRAVSEAQTMLLEAQLLALDLPPARFEVIRIPPERRAGFLAARSPHAAVVEQRLRAAGVFVDSRGDIVRLGPAPYVTEGQLRAAVEAIAVTCARRD